MYLPYTKEKGVLTHDQKRGRAYFDSYFFFFFFFLDTNGCLFLLQNLTVIPTLFRHLSVEKMAFKVSFLTIYGEIKSIKKSVERVPKRVKKPTSIFCSEISLTVSQGQLLLHSKCVGNG